MWEPVSPARFLPARFRIALTPRAAAHTPRVTHMETPPTVPFLDVPTLLERSQPRPRGPWLWYGMGLFLMLVLLGRLGAGASPVMARLIEAGSLLLMLGLMTGMGVLAWVGLSRLRTEQHQLVAVEELTQLRRWQEAATVLDGLLSRPMRAPQSRIRALVYLASVLARYHRFADAITVQDYVLEHADLDPGTTYGLHLGRAMSMLREDHLLDADRAIAGLRRQRATAGHQESGGLALVELYRDVKTGHAEEAIEIFESRRVAMRDQLGHRLADACALAARAYDMVGRAAEAGQAWLDATALAPVAELTRRYPEVGPVVAKYPATPVPAEVAA